MSSHSQMNWERICLIIMAVFCITVGLIYLKDILMPFAVSIFLYFLVLPIIEFLQVKANLHRSLSMVITILAGVLIASLILLSFFISIKLFAPEAGNYHTKLVSFASGLRELAADYGFELSPSLVAENLKSIPVVTTLKSLTGSLVEFLGNSLLVLVILLFLIEGKNPQAKRGKNLDAAMNRINLYVSTKFFVSVGTGLLVWLTLFLLGVDLAGMFGVLTFLLNFIPSVGSLVAVLLPLPIVALEHGFGGIFWLAIVLPGIIQVVVGNIVEPKIMGASLGLHPLVQLFSLFFWGAIWGVTGMFLAVPLTVVLKLFLEQFSGTEYLSALLEGRLP